MWRSLIQLTDNRGFGAGCNVGWRATSAPFVLFLNPDARIEAAAVHRLAAVLRADASVGAVAPKILADDGAVDTSLRRFPRVRSTFAQALFLHRLFPKADWTDELIRDGDAYRHPRSSTGPPERACSSGATFWSGSKASTSASSCTARTWTSASGSRRPATASGSSPRPSRRTRGGESSPRAKLLPVLAASRIRYARKHRGVAGEVAERAGVALGAATHGLVGRGGWAVRAGHCRAIALRHGADGGRPP